MAVIINGTTGITNVNGTAAAPAETGTDTDSGIVYGTNTVSLATNGTTALTVGSDQNVVLNSTGAVTLPSGTTAQRPASPTVGMIRYNTTLSKYEVYRTLGWASLTASLYSYNIDYLVIAGGGGGGGHSGAPGFSAGGGGAGGYQSLTSQTVNVGTSYTVTVGGGGAGGTSSGSGTSGTSGSNSSFSSTTSAGGGGGGARQTAGVSGGSGGGGGATASSGGSGNTPSTSPSQGNNGA